MVVPYRPPVIALVQPPDGGTVPRDKPVVVFRFVPGEATDPIDPQSFRVAIDGADRTALFQVAAGEAWGPLASPDASDEDPLTAGAYRVAARICSSRGACDELTATVTVLESLATPAVPEMPKNTSRRAKLLEFMLDAARRILVP